MMTRTQCCAVGLGLGVVMPCLPRRCDDVGEVLGRDGEVEEAIAAGVELARPARRGAALSFS